MTQHKWHKEIKAWADGAEIQYYAHDTWEYIGHPQWHLDYEYRIKPQPKQPKYLYVNRQPNGLVISEYPSAPTGSNYIGKIEVDDDYLI